MLYNKLHVLQKVNVHLKMQKLHEHEKENEKVVENEIEKYFDYGLRCPTYSSVGLIFGNRYCRCGMARSIYTHQFDKYASKTSVNYNSLRDKNDVSTKDILKIDRDAVFLTKKSLMLNQFMEYRNDAKGKVETASRWLQDISEVAGYSKNCGGGGVVNVVDDDNSRSLCLTSSPLLDKRFVSLLRGITLYWFICLNTVFAKSSGGDAFKRKGPIILDGDIGATKTSFTNAFSTSATTLPTLCASLSELQLSFLFERTECLKNDLLWNLFRDTIAGERGNRGDTTRPLSSSPFEQILKKNVSGNTLRNIVETLINAWCHSVDVWQELVPRPQSSPSPSPSSFSTKWNDDESAVIASNNSNDFVYFGGCQVNDAHVDGICLGQMYSSSSPADRSVDCTSKETAETSSSSSSPTAGDEVSCTDYSAMPTILFLPGGYETTLTRGCDCDSSVDGCSSSESESTAYPESDADTTASPRSDLESISVVSDVLSSEADDSELMELINADIMSKEMGSPTTNTHLDENRYFLPEGILNVEKEVEFPLYDLWRSPLDSLDMLHHRDASAVAVGSPAPPPPPLLLPPPPVLSPPKVITVHETCGGVQNDDFTPYQLWKTSVVSRHEYIPKFGSDRDAPAASLLLLSSSSSSSSAASKQRTRIDALEKPSTYSLWGSPIMVDFKQISSSELSRPTELSVAAAAAAAASEVVEELADDIVKSHQRHESFKFSNFKPIMTGGCTVTLTDRGAFKYYRKPASFDDDEGDATAAPTSPEDDCVPLSASMWNIFSELNESLEEEEEEEDDEEKVEMVVEVIVDTDVEIGDINKNSGETADELSESASFGIANSSYYFRPIQPAFKVPTDPTPVVERSPSGTYYHKDRKLMIFEHELDCQSTDPYLFQPKFILSANEKACQTDDHRNILVAPNVCASTSRNSVLIVGQQQQQLHQPQHQQISQFFCNWEPTSNSIVMSREFVSSNTSPFSRPLFYSLGDVFNYLGQPGFTNVGEYSVSPFSSVPSV